MAGNDATPIDVLRKLADDRNHTVRWHLAQNRHPATVDLALRAEHSDTRLYLAQRNDLPDTAIDALIADPDPEVRVSLATCTTRADVLRRLASDEHKQVRSAVGVNRRCPAEVTDVLVTDRSPDVRASVVWNEPTLAHLELLAADKDADVRSVVAHKLALAPELGTGQSKPMPDIDLDTMRMIVEEMARTADTPEDAARILDVLSHDPTPPGLQQALSESPDRLQALVVQLADDRSDYVANTARRQLGLDCRPAAPARPPRKPKPLSDRQRSAHAFARLVLTPLFDFPDASGADKSGTTASAKERRWDLDAMTRSALTVCESLSAAVAETGVRAPRSSSWLWMRYEPSEFVEFQPNENPRDENIGEILVPEASCFASPAERRRAMGAACRLALEHLGTVAGWDSALAAEAMERARAEDYRFTWSSPWKSTRDRRLRFRTVASAEDDGCFWWRLEVEPRAGGQSWSSPSYVGGSNLNYQHELARTMRQTGEHEVTFDFGLKMYQVTQMAFDLETGQPRVELMCRPPRRYPGDPQRARPLLPSTP